jgi:hypothetical protein
MFTDERNVSLIISNYRNNHRDSGTDDNYNHGGNLSKSTANVSSNSRAINPIISNFMGDSNKSSFTALYKSNL